MEANMKLYFKIERDIVTMKTFNESFQGEVSLLKRGSREVLTAKSSDINVIKDVLAKNPEWVKGVDKIIVSAKLTDKDFAVEI